MARDPKYDCLFEPIRIGPKTMKNRFYQVPHCNGAGSERPGAQAAFRGMKAEGGWGGICTEYCLDPSRNRTMCTGSRRAFGTRATSSISAICATKFTNGAHWPGSRCGTAGRTRPAWKAGPPLVARAQIASEFETRTYPREADEDDIKDLIQMYVDAAQRRGARRLRHHLCLRRAQLPAAPIPLEVLQQTHRQIWRQLREPRALLDRRRSPP